MKKINIDAFSYGDLLYTLERAVKWLNENKWALEGNDEPFDFPDYWGMPESISSNLTPDEVDWIQSQTHTWVDWLQSQTRPLDG
jgi:hypothetical protein